MLAPTKRVAEDEVKNGPVAESVPTAFLIRKMYPVAFNPGLAEIVAFKLLKVAPQEYELNVTSSTDGGIMFIVFPKYAKISSLITAAALIV